MPCGVLPKIEDYGAIGDCRSAALVSRYGSIDFLCWPRFDSPTLFAALLDRQHGGYWAISPEQSYTAQFTYAGESNVLRTTFRFDSGAATLTDLMPAWSEEHKHQFLVPEREIIRELRCVEGEMRFCMDFCPRPDFGRRKLRMHNCGSLGLQIEAGRGACWLRSSVPLTLNERGAFASATLKQGDSVQFSLTYAEQAPATLPLLGRATEETIESSIAWWSAWARRCRYDGPYRDAVVRSALALKLLTYSPSGAVVAAVTTSLPERIGDTLNWDYRYCWLRDASLTIRAMLGLGYAEDAESFLTWLLHATRTTQPELRVLYTVFGEIAPHEHILEMSGYRDSPPVRIGNGARGQLQLDIYGEVIDAAAQYAEGVGRYDRTTQKVLIGLGKYVAANWNQPDEGIWEPRSGRRDNTHSRLMCWVALDRLLALSDKQKLRGAPTELFARERERIRREIEQRGWNESIQSYVSTLDGDEMDASLLRLSWYGFEHADSYRMQCTHQRVGEELGAGDHLLYRYRREPPEGAFGACCFWGVEQLAQCDRTLPQAHRAFDQLLSYRNELGLFAEEVDPNTGEALGNYPQAFTHIGLISAAITMEERERGAAHPAVKAGSDVQDSRAKARP
jgi:GH15 family glucan-1,4-alpha-glucosidase